MIAGGSPIGAEDIVAARVRQEKFSLAAQVRIMLSDSAQVAAMTIDEFFETVTWRGQLEADEDFDCLRRRKDR